MSRQFSSAELAAAYLADPLRIPPPGLSCAECDVVAALEILRENKVPLLSLAETQWNGELLQDPGFEAARRQEAQELAALHAEYSPVKEALASADIADVLIKSVGLAPSFPYRSDNLDVLYHPGDVEQVRATLTELGYVELRNVEEPHKYLFRKFHMGRSVSAIHVHAHVGWMVSFLDEEALWRRCQISQDDPLVTIPATEDALLITLAHYFYEDKRVALLDVLKLAHCLRQSVDWDEVYRIATWRGWRDGLNVSLLLSAYQEHGLYGETLVPQAVLDRAWLELAPWARAFLHRWLGEDALCSARTGRKDAAGNSIRQLPLHIPFAFSKIFFYAKLVRDPTRSARRKVKDLAVHTANGSKLRLRIHSQPSMLVTLSGIDGSGKTTQAEALASAFHTCHLRANTTWSRGGSSRWIGWFTRFGKRAAQQNGQLPERPPSGMDKVHVRQRRFQSPLLRWGWSWLTTLELLLHYARHVTLPLLRGRVVICDRYIYDVFADWAAYCGEQEVDHRWAAKALRWLTPHPRMRYWLDVPADVAQSRSAGQLPEDFLRVQARAYGRMSELFKLQRLDGSQTKEDIADHVVYQVLSRYFADYRTMINTLFLKNPGQWR